MDVKRRVKATYRWPPLYIFIKVLIKIVLSNINPLLTFFYKKCMAIPIYVSLYYLHFFVKKCIK